MPDEINVPLHDIDEDPRILAMRKEADKAFSPEFIKRLMERARRNSRIPEISLTKKLREIFGHLLTDKRRLRRPKKSDRYLRKG